MNDFETLPIGTRERLERLEHAAEAVIANWDSGQLRGLGARINALRDTLAPQLELASEQQRAWNNLQHALAEHRATEGQA